MPTKKQRTTITVDDETKNFIQKYKEERDLGSENAAIVEILRYGIQSVTESGLVHQSPLQAAAQKTAKTYTELDNFGRMAVDAVMAAELRRTKEQKAKSKASFVEFPKPPPMRKIPLIGNSFAAGIGEPDFGNALEEYEVPADTKADFAVRVNGDSMEPYLKNGSIALGVKGAPRDGDVVAIMVDGAFYVKQVSMDNYGNLYLFSLNRKRRDMDVTVRESAQSNVSCFGKILMEEKVPLPDD